MQGSDIFGALVRRWYLVALGVAATVALCLMAARFVAPTYEAQASVLLLPPRVISDVGGNGGNPFLGLGGLGPAASIVSRAMTDSGTAQGLKDQGSQGKYTVAPDLSSSGPVLLVTAAAASPQEALQTLGLVLEEVPRTLSTLQQSVGAPTKTLLTTTVINQDRKSVEVRKSQIRAILVAILAAMGGTVFGVSLIDGLLARRTRGGGRGAGSPRAKDEPLHLQNAPPPDDDDTGDDDRQDRPWPASGVLKPVPTVAHKPAATRGAPRQRWNRTEPTEPWTRSGSDR
jgi:hypothetical protein